MKVFITGASGYVGKRVAKLLLERGHSVSALVRKGSENKVPQGCSIVFGNALDATTYAGEVTDHDTLIHLVGVSHPSPKKKDDFIRIDLASAQQAATAAKQAGVKHIVYISVAQTPTKIMHDYQQARKQAEEAFKNTDIPVTFLRPWYIIGPGHYWPLLFLPFYKLFELMPQTRDAAKNLKLVYLPQVLRSLIHAVENPATGERVIEIGEIRKM